MPAFPAHIDSHAFESAFGAKLAYNQILKEAKNDYHHIEADAQGKLSATVTNPETGEKHIYKVKRRIVNGNEAYSLETARYDKPITSLKAHDTVSFKNASGRFKETNVSSSTVASSTIEKKDVYHPRPSTANTASTNRTWRKESSSSAPSAEHFGEKPTSHSVSTDAFPEMAESPKTFKSRFKKARKNTTDALKVGAYGIASICKGISSTSLLLLDCAFL